MPSSSGWAPTACLPGRTCIGFEQDAAGVDRPFSRHAHGRAARRPARRCARRVRWPALGHPQGAASERRRATLFRRQHVARRFGLAADPDRGEHDSRRLACDRQDGHLSDSRPRRRRRTPARQLGRRSRDTPSSSARLDPRRAHSTISSAHSTSWHFDWLDVPAMIRAADTILEFPMVDQDPLPWWTQGRVTLLGDAAHPMYPRGSNGAGQAILDARALCDALATTGSVTAALKAYEAQAAARDRRRRAHEPQQSARRDPARSVRANRRQAVRRASTTS